MKNNEKEKIWNEELRKKIVSLILVFLFKIIFVIYSFFYSNLKIFEKVFDYATGIVFFRTILFDLGKIYFKNIYTNSKKIFYSFIKLFLIILIINFLIMCFIFNSEAIPNFIKISLLYIALSIVLVFIHIIILTINKPKHSITFIVLSIITIISFYFIDFKLICYIFLIITLVVGHKSLSKIFESNFSEQDRNISVVFSTLLTTTLITWFICFIYFFIMKKCNNSIEIEKNSFFFSGLFSIIKEICDYFAKYITDENVDKNIFKKFFKK
jgi:membrane protein